MFKEEILIDYCLTALSLALFLWIAESVYYLLVYDKLININFWLIQVIGVFQIIVLFFVLKQLDIRLLEKLYRKF